MILKNLALPTNHSMMKYKNNLINIFEVVNRVRVRDILDEAQTAAAQMNILWLPCDQENIASLS